MLILSSTSDKLQIALGAGGNVTVHASYLDNVAGSVNPQRKNTLITTTTLTDIVTSPANSIQRNVKTLHIHNNGAAANAVSVILTDGTTAVTLASQTLAPNATLQYIDEIGFVLSDFNERMPFINLTANYTVGFFDRNGIINVNGSFTLGLLAATTAGAGFVFRIRNTGMQTVTIDPNASETIDGKATIPCCAKEEFLVACDGTNWVTLGRDSLVMIGTGTVSGATFQLTLPPNFTKFEIEMAQIVYGTPGYIGMNLNFNGPYATGYYMQRLYAFGTTIAADPGAGLNTTPVQFSANSGVTFPDFDATLNLWPDPIIVPRTASFHFTSRTSFANDGTSAIINAGGWAVGDQRCTMIMFGSTGGPFTQGRWTLRGQRPG
jgi:hypothetical protein